MPDELTPDDDARLSALYREAEDDVEPPGEWSSLRELIGAARESGFDEEPSPRIDALLMAAAKQHAPAPKASWWARLAAWMKPVVMHPAMAGATALLVVAGAAGVMYRRGDGEVARPTPPAAHTPTVATEPDDDGDVRSRVEPPAPESETYRAPASASAPEAPAAGSAALPTVAPTKPVDPTPSPGSGATGKSGRARGATARSRDEAVGGAARVDELGGLEVQMTPTMSADDAVTVTPPPPPPPPPTAPAAGAPAEERAESSNRVAEVIASDVSEREALLRAARAAAKRGDCASVQSMSVKVRALDAAYHRDVFVRDPDVARCLKS